MFDYEVFPLVVPADSEAEIRIRPKFGHRKFPAAAKLKVTLLPLDGLCPDGVWRGPERSGDCGELAGWSLEPDGSLLVRGRFAGEQEHNLTVEMEEPGCRTADRWSLRGGESVRFNLYSVGADLYGLLPFKGDFHMHSEESDGRESPEYVAARCREFGMDFIAVTDHSRYHPSLRAMKVWRELPTGLKLYPGEEVHTPDNPVHIINFGGSASVNDLARSDEAKYRGEVAALAAELGELPPGLDPFPVAASHWAFDRIREAGGVAVFCHPYWQQRQYMITEAVTSEILRRRRFDAFELIGGFYPSQWRSNNFQVARYGEEQAAGGRFPVVGLSDSHGVDRDFERDRLAGWYYTLALAESDEFPDLAAAIRAGRCAAVEQVGSGIPRVHGEFRLVRYLSFLLESYFPYHDRLCAEEGMLMADALGGDPVAKEALRVLSGRAAEFRRRCFA